MMFTDFDINGDLLSYVLEQTVLLITLLAGYNRVKLEGAVKLLIQINSKR